MSRAAIEEWHKNKKEQTKKKQLEISQAMQLRKASILSSPNQVRVVDFTPNSPDIVQAAIEAFSNKVGLQ
jgi:hypothetical protein